MQVKNISDIKYFTEKFDLMDYPYKHELNYHPDAPVKMFTSPTTFMAEFMNCKVNSLPLLITEDNEMITDHVWPLVHKEKYKPEKSHNYWNNGSWGPDMKINIPPVTKKFDIHKWFVWLPVDSRSVNNPWHVWIDMISKFRLIEDRYAVHWEKQHYILSQPSPYFEKIRQKFFPDTEVTVMPPNSTWEFSHLLVPSMSNRLDGVIVPQVADWIRWTFAPRKTKQFRKIWISRKNSITRNVTNEDEVFMHLKGWDILKLEDLTLEQQMKYFSEAEVVVGPHGAGFTNLLWCNPGTKVVELQDSKMLSKKVYPILAHHLNLDFKIFTPDTIPVQKVNGERPAGVKRHSDLINFKIDIPKLLVFFQDQNII